MSCTAACRRPMQGPGSLASPSFSSGLFGCPNKHRSTIGKQASRWCEVTDSEGSATLGRGLFPVWQGDPACPTRRPPHFPNFVVSDQVGRPNSLSFCLTVSLQASKPVHGADVVVTQHSNASLLSSSDLWRARSPLVRPNTPYGTCHRRRLLRLNSYGTISPLSRANPAKAGDAKSSV